MHSWGIKRLKENIIKKGMPQLDAFNLVNCGSTAKSLRYIMGIDMKKFKKWSKICVAALLLSLTAPTVLPMSNTVIAQAAAVKISQKKLTLEVGASKVLKLTGTKGKVTWSTSKKSVAEVSKTGKVTAKKAGKATITATIGKKKYTCQVTVTAAAAVNPLVKKAPFEAKEANYKKISYIMPKDFKTQIISEQEKAAMLMLYPANGDAEKGYSSVVLTIEENENKKPDYSVTKEYFSSYITETLIKNQYTQQGIEADVTNFKTSDYETKLGTAFKTEYQVSFEGGSIKQALYDIFIDNYFFEITVSNTEDNVTPDINTVAEYLINTLQVTK